MKSSFYARKIKKIIGKKMKQLLLDLQAIQILANEGALTKVIVSPAPMEKGYLLTFITKEKNQVFCTTARTQNMRIFKTFETVAQTAKKIGFSKVEVTL